MTFPAGSKQWNDRTNPGAAPLVIAHGDSISLTGLVQRTYLIRLAALMVTAGLTPAWKRCGTNGASWAYSWVSAGYPLTLTQDALVRVDPFRRGNSWLVVFAGTNGIQLGSHSAATEYANFQTYIAARVAAGWSASRIVVCTMLPRTGMSEVTRTSYNASLVGDSGGVGYKLARLDLDASIGAAGQDTNLTWFVDGTHPTDAGHAIIAQLVYNVMFP